MVSFSQSINQHLFAKAVKNTTAKFAPST